MELLGKYMKIVIYSKYPTISGQQSIPAPDPRQPYPYPDFMSGPGKCATPDNRYHYVYRHIIVLQFDLIHEYRFFDIKSYTWHCISLSCIDIGIVPSPTSAIFFSGVYIVFNMALITISIFLSSFVMYVQNRWESHKPVPQWIKAVK